MQLVCPHSMETHSNWVYLFHFGQGTDGTKPSRAENLNVMDQGDPVYGTVVNMVHVI